MPIRFGSLGALLDHGFDTVIDVRSPAEFAEDHIPGAINLPAMSNDERAQVGTIYTQDSPFRARKIGAAIVSRNVASHLEGPLSEKAGDWRPLVYCWRGGQRSGSVAIILEQIGWRAATVQGGYQAYRRLVYDAFYNQPLPHRFVLLDGLTGTAKTRILHQLAQQGVQTLDLEGAANHRGSMLGGFDAPQPSQKAFESRLAADLAALDPTKPVVVEAESSKIGRLIVPPSIWQAMLAAPAIEVAATLDERVRFLVAAYRDVVTDRDELVARLQPLRQFRSNSVVDHWQDMLAQNDLTAFARSVIAEHYDPAYAKSRINMTPVATVDVAELTDSGIAQAAAMVADKVRSL